jgi:hypothetical protein
LWLVYDKVHAISVKDHRPRWKINRGTSWLGIRRSALLSTRKDRHATDEATRNNKGRKAF